MTAPAARPPPRRRRLAAVALITAFSFGCTTIRAPVSIIQGPVSIRDGAADPQLELWLESAGPITPEEAAGVTGKARAALEAALVGRVVGDGSSVLVVRAQGVTRTRSHRSDQTTATVALVATAVVVVIAAVLWIANGAKGGGGGDERATHAAPRSGSGGSIRAPPPSVSPAAPVAHAPRSAPRPPPMASRPQPHHHHDGGPVSVGVSLDLGPVLFDPAPGELVAVSSRELPGPDAEPAPGVPLEAGVDPLAAAEVVPLAAGQVVLPPLRPFQAEERGFFDGDSLALELTLVDRVTGEPRWTKWVQADVDPLDEGKVSTLIAKALDEADGWQPAR